MGHDQFFKDFFRIFFRDLLFRGDNLQSAS